MDSTIDPKPTAAIPIPSVLVVDDTIENLRLLSDLLSDHGYDVRAVTNGVQALQAVEHARPI
jgi:CheY-like chemotaxis protein